MAQRKSNTEIMCPCGSSKTYSKCCQPFLSGASKPQTAVELMRSRYTACVKTDVDYLIKTLHPRYRRPEDRFVILEWLGNCQWEKLQVIQKQKGQASDKEGIVEFRAWYRDSNGLGSHHERSRFVKEEGQWFYTDGDYSSQ